MDRDLPVDGSAVEDSSGLRETLRRVAGVRTGGQGFGRRGMQLAEDYARSHGATTLGLSVFGFNHAARGLYESLGYEVTSVKMRKAL